MKLNEKPVSSLVLLGIISAVLLIAVFVVLVIIPYAYNQTINLGG